MASFALLAVSVLLIVAVLGYRFSATSRSKSSLLPLPPGPKPKFLLGNAADFPPAGAKEWQHWIEHKRLYGPISSLSVMGQNIIILNDHQTTVDLLEKRSAIYSSRPKMVFAGDMCGWEHSMILQPYGDSSRAYRRATQPALGTMSALESFKPQYDTEIRRFLLRVLRNPEDLQAHIRTTAGAVILRSTYGYEIDPHSRDPLVDLINETMMQFSDVSQPGKWAVDLVPALQYLPDWFPGTGFKQYAKHCKETLLQAGSIPYAFVEKQLRTGEAPTSYLSRLITSADAKMSADEAYIARWTAFSLYAGGADTTVSSMSTFFLLMTLHPEIQHVAQKELDSVLGDARLPAFTDRPNLPCTEALIKEVFRFHPVAPIDFPHVNTQDDEYEGYSIPKDSLILANIWAMLHDPAVYASPDTFNPERFLGAHPEPDPKAICFGFGRRICPGRHVADLTLWLEIASSLFAFDIRKTRDANGIEITPDLDFTPGVISRPAPYTCDVRPRSARHAELIEAIETEQPWSSQGDAPEVESLIRESATKA
ncbi:uncharacterized protein HMPREF1541_06245 [Cyphellophora europaea CBS 101466]|uniref:Cytochrome P450 n=1 Tax=Cyphellophora europaea (strain CBS 101466) TaxID=1220924 RepID=W2RR54_CYPE1|nr:uncharacterized protein HMPREF1541_06245 [Cyphellophora europaea CBS 101466]ETN38214.1 hypothetical protein HMPREF1541_06245 [Cyphellophora europaea CBS 101466]